MPDTGTPPNTDRYMLRLPADMKRRLDEAAAREERSIAVIIRRAISTELARIESLEERDQCD